MLWWVFGLLLLDSEEAAGAEEDVEGEAGGGGGRAVAAAAAAAGRGGGERRAEGGAEGGEWEGGWGEIGARKEGWVGGASFTRTSSSGGDGDIAECIGKKEAREKEREREK